MKIGKEWFVETRTKAEFNDCVENSDSYRDAKTNLRQTVALFPLLSPVPFGWKPYGGNSMMGLPTAAKTAAGVEITIPVALKTATDHVWVLKVKSN